jgi:hypothetical protein
MLVTLWIGGGARETRDADFLGHGDPDHESLKASLARIMAIEVDDGLVFDLENLAATSIREGADYQGIRISTTASLERTRIPVTIDIGFGDALGDAARPLSYPSLLGMERPQILTYPPATVIAEKFQAMVALGVANGRMKDYFDLWAIPEAVPIADAELDAAIRATFERRRTAIPTDRPPGLSVSLIEDPIKRQQWQAYAQSIGHDGLSLAEVVDAIWALVGPSCGRVTAQGRA